jgi:hypothetical protein
MPAVVGVIVLAAVGGILIHFFKLILAIGFIAVAAVVVPRVVPHILKERYFASDEFLTHKGKIATVVAEHNEVARYVSEIRSRGSFSLSVSSTGTQAHLASFQNTSHHKYRRDRNVAITRHRTCITARYR